MTTRRESAEKYEAHTLTLTADYRVLIIEVIESSERFFTARIMRINKDGSIRKGDEFGRKTGTMAHSAVQEIN